MIAADVCPYGHERLHANASLPASAFMTPDAARRLVLDRYSRVNVKVEVVSVKRIRWGKFAFARCSGVADDRMVYVVRLRYPDGFIFSHGIYEPGALVDAVVDARSGERFTGHTIGRAICFSGGPQRPAILASPDPHCAALFRRLTH